MKRIKIAAVLIAGLLLLENGIHAQTDPALIWTTITGPWNSSYDGTFGAIAIDPSNPNTMYLGSSTFGPGMFKSLDGGNNWTEINSGVLVNVNGDYQPIIKIVVAPSNPSTLYFCTAATAPPLVDGAGYIWRSSDGGTSWQLATGQVNLLNLHQVNGLVYDLDVDPANPNIVYAAVAGQGILKTTDGGVNWSVLYGGASSEAELDFFTSVRVCPSDSSTVFFAGVHDYTEDVVPNPAWLLGEGAGEDEEGSVPGTTGVVPMPIYKSSDGGSTWQALTTTPSLALCTDLQFDPNGTLFASTLQCVTPFSSLAAIFSIGNKGIFKSTDLGQTWQTANQASFGSLAQFGLISLCSSPAQTKSIFAATGFSGLIIASLDDGNTWIRLDPCLANTFVAKMASAGTKIFALTSAGVFCSDLSTLYAPPTPAINSISPLTLRVSSSPQAVTISGSNFVPPGNPNASTVVVVDSSSNQQLIVPTSGSASSLQFNALIGPATGAWQMYIQNGLVRSLPYNFNVAPTSAQLLGLSISGPANIFQGTSGNQYTATELLSDNTQSPVAVTWSVNSGAPASISSSGQLTANSGVNTTITITASYTLAGTTKTANYAVKISPLNTCGSSIQDLVTNGNFESGNTDWSLTGGAEITTYGSLYHSATHYLWLGDDNSTDSAYFQTTIPSSTTAADATMWININTSEPTSLGNYDTLAVQIRDPSGNVLATLTNFSNLNPQSYQFYDFPVAQFAGRTIRIYFVSTCHLSSGATTNFRIDDVDLIATVPNPPIPVLYGMNGPTAVPQNSTAQYNAITIYCNDTIQATTPGWSVTGSASISTAGLLTANTVSADSAATVTATFNDGSKINYPITVTHIAPVYTALAISGMTTVSSGQSIQLTGEEMFSDGSIQVVTPSWSINSSAASISSSGGLTASTVSADTVVTITATFTDGNSTHSATQQVTILFIPPPPSPVSLSILGPAAVAEASSAQFVAAMQLSSGAQQVVSPNWSANLPQTTFASSGVLMVDDHVTSNVVSILAANYTIDGITVASSNELQVLFAPPNLMMQTIGGQILMSWPTNYPDFYLVSSPDLDAPLWSSVTNTPSISGAQFNMTSGMPGPQQFFRLKEN